MTEAILPKRAPVQADYYRPRDQRNTPPGTIEWSEHLEVYEAYRKRYFGGQSAERIADRGGFGKNEAEMLLGRPLKTWKERGK